MAMRKGRCVQFGNCSQADKHVVLDVPSDGEFVCSECGHPLQPVLTSGGGNRWKVPLIGAVALVVLLGASYWVYHKFSSTDTTGPSVAGSKGQENQIRARVNIWVGCAGGLAANGGLDTQPGSIFDQEGLKVSFKIIDDWTEGASALANGNVDVMLTTVDVWAKDYAKFKEKGFNAKAFLMVDWSRGADGVIGASGIRSIEDLAGKSIAFAPYTPSHFLIWNGLKNSGLTREQRETILNKAVHTKDGIEPATLFAQGQIDSAVAWDPDMSDAVSKRPGSTKIYDTKVANKLIADILVVSDQFLSDHPETVRKFAEGWLKGVKYINENPERAYNLIGGIKDFNIPADLAKTMLQGVYLSDYSENQAFFGTAGAGSDYENIFSMSQDMYRELLQIKERTQSIEGTLARQPLLALLNKFPVHAPERVKYGEEKPGDKAFSNQKLTIYFDVDSATISPDSRATVDQVGGFLKAYENTIVDIVGNTDSNGAREHNIQLSKARAESVKQYLVSKYGFPPARFHTEGKGPDSPVADNGTPEGREKNRRTDINVYANTAR